MKVFQRIFAPLSPQKYLDRSFMERSVYVPGHARKFDFLFSARDFRDNLDRVDIIRAVFPGFRRARIQPDEIPDMVSAGATVCVTGLESAHPKVQRHLETIKRELNFPGRLSLRAYASPPGSGFDLHYDACAVTTLHLAGEKEWWYSEKPVVRFPERNSPNESLAPNSAFRSVRLKRVVMAPGDLLALPPGALHRARAKTVCLALNLAFEYLGARYVDLVQQESGRRASRSEELRRPLPRLSPAEGRRPAAEFKRQTQKTIDCLIAGLVEMRESDEWVPRALRALYE